MKRTHLVVLLGVILGALAYGQPLPAEIKIANETIPPGGTVQFKFSLTEPRPIMTGTKLVGLDATTVDALFGVSLNSLAGDAFGVAKYENGQFRVRYVSPFGSYGLLADYPVLTVTAHLAAAARIGSQVSVDLGTGSIFAGFLGQSAPFVVNRPGVLTVGGSLAVHNVVPGGGAWPAGTVVKILGTGFTPATQVKAKFKVRSTTFINANEIDVVLALDTRVDSQRIDLTNPDKSTVTYYSYLRGSESTPSAVALVAAAEPVFPQIALRRATIIQASRGLQNSIATALAIQNSNAEPATVVLTASTPMGQIGQKTITLNFGEKITRELGEYFGAQLAPGTVVRIASSAAVQLVPFHADSATGSLTPFVPIPF